jgi:hypothetical protein
LAPSAAPGSAKAVRAESGPTKAQGPGAVGQGGICGIASWPASGSCRK